ncbi:MAG: endonuclease NucS [Candidatus Jordarchaeaceae archaeon]
MSIRQPVEYYCNPDSSTGAGVIIDALKKNRTLIIIGECTIEYRGRANSELGLGERIVLIKKDGSFLVHRAWDSQPVNWQPPGCIFQTKSSKKGVLLKAIRKKPRESIGILFLKLFIILVLNLKDEAEFIMFGSEEDMQRAILAKPELIEEGFKPILKEKVVEQGFVDVYGVDNQGRTLVIELKRRKAQVQDVLQLLKYLEDIKRKSAGRPFRAMLAAPSISKEASLMIQAKGLEFKTLSPKTCAEVLRLTASKKITEFM